MAYKDKQLPSIPIPPWLKNTRAIEGLPTLPTEIPSMAKDLRRQHIADQQTQIVLVPRFPSSGRRQTNRSSR